MLRSLSLQLSTATIHNNGSPAAKLLLADQTSPRTRSVTTAKRTAKIRGFQVARAKNKAEEDPFAPRVKPMIEALRAEGLSLRLIPRG